MALRPLTYKQLRTRADCDRSAQECLELARAFKRATQLGLEFHSEPDDQLLSLVGGDWYDEERAKVIKRAEHEGRDSGRALDRFHEENAPLYCYWTRSEERSSRYGALGGMIGYADGYAMMIETVRQAVREREQEIDEKVRKLRALDYAEVWLKGLCDTCSNSTFESLDTLQALIDKARKEAR